MMMSAEMAYLAKDYARSLELYKLLKDRASTPERRQLAATGMLRSAAMTDNKEEVILAATAVLSDATALLNPEVSSQLAEFERMAEEIKSKQKILKDKILAEMEERGILKIETDELMITYIAPTGRETFDSKTFRKDNPDLYDKYVKISNVSASVRMKLK